MEQPLESALTHHRAGRLKEAERGYRDILGGQPDHPNALHLLGVLAHQAGNDLGAVDLIRRAIQCNPKVAAYHSNLGNALAAAKRLEEAADSFRAALDLDPKLADAHANLSAALHGLGRFAESEHAARAALGLKADFPGALFNLANALRGQGRPDEAHGPVGEALALAPDYAAAHALLGSTLKDLSRFGDSETSFRRALEIDPNLPEIHANLGNALRDQGRIGEAEACFRRALEIRPGYAEAHSNLLFSMHYDGGHPPRALFAEAQAWNSRHASGLAASRPAQANPPDPGRRLRLGYVSGDFCRHSVGYFMASVLAAHNAADFEVICYSNTARRDSMTDRLRGSGATWRDILTLSDEAAAELIRGDRVDVLVDLSGHTGGNRLAVFARRPAPVQITYLGYPDTTGMTAMDYRLSDRWADPEGAPDSLCSEELVRLEKGFLCYSPPTEAPQVGPPPVAASGQVTFGSFNNLAKLSPQTLDLWAKVLLAVPDSRLLVKSRPLADAGVRARFLTGFDARGVAPGRVECLGVLESTADHLKIYNRVDIGLDATPYNGTTTTCEAMWMGVPVVALAGDRHAARVGVSLLTSVGLGDLIAASAAEYAEIAAALARDPPRLAELRQRLRGRLAASPLTDGAGFTRELEATYRRLWRRWCTGVPEGRPIENGATARGPMENSQMEDSPMEDSPMEDHGAANP